MHGLKKLLIALAFIAAPTAASATKTISIDLIGLSENIDPNYGGDATVELQLSFVYSAQLGL